ncbi:NACHT N-terminal Helical domain 1-containing protein [Streptomyces sp. NPDC002446]
MNRAAQSTGVEERLPAYEQRAVAHAVADSLRSLGYIDMDDVQAVQLGHLALSRRLRSQSPSATIGLSIDAVTLHASVLDTACLHILQFFTQRSTFVARTLIEHSRRSHLGRS